MKNLCISFIFIISLAACNEGSRIEIETVSAPGLSNAAQPYLFALGDTLYMSWQESDDSIHHLKYSKFTAGEWQDAVTLGSGGNWFINWADFPSLSVNDKSQILSHYLPKSDSATYAYDIQVVLAGIDTTYKLHDDTVKGEHGFVSSIPYQKDKFFITWLDGRNAPAEEGDHHHAGTMTLRAAIINASGTKEHDWLLDEKVCDCCQTSIAPLENGVAIVYRDRSGEEYRDVSMRKYINGSWTAPQKIGNDNWKITGCPVNGPKISASGSNVVVAWYTGVDDATVVKLVVSQDNAETFSEPVIVSTQTIGRVDAAFDGEGNIYVSYIAVEKASAQLIVSKFDPAGSPIGEYIVSNLDGARSTGFPQMEFLNKYLYFAWTDANDPGGIVLKRINTN